MKLIWHCFFFSNKSIYLSCGRQITLLFWRPPYNPSSSRQITLLFWRLPDNSSLLAAARQRQINYIKLYFNLCNLQASVLFISFRFFTFYSFLFFCFVSFLTILFSCVCVSFFSFLFVTFPLVFFSFFFLSVSFRFLSFFFPFLNLQVPTCISF